MSSKALRVLCIGMPLWIATPGPTQSPWLVPYGTGSCGSDFVPTFHAAGEMPVLGNASFQVVSENLIGNTAGILFLSALPANLSVLGMKLHVDPLLGFSLLCQAGGAAGVAGAGSATIPMAIPNDANLLGGKLYLQGFFVDTALPSLLVHTHGLGMTIALSISPFVAIIRDRLKYQAFFSGAMQAKAGQIGQAIWAANQVTGFAYVKTEQFTCGGESHWMVIVRHTQTGLEFCLVPGGSYRMGDINGTGDNNELPVHWVHINPFLLARTEVPQSLWQAVMGSNPSSVQWPTYPVDQVSWNDAQVFCARTGLRLPSEAEWEYACQAGVETDFNFGQNYPMILTMSWINGMRPYASIAAIFDPYPFVKAFIIGGPVASKAPNGFGIYEMHSHVGEWCEDTYDDYRCAPSDGRARLRQNDPCKVIRGGFVWGEPWVFRSASRDMYWQSVGGIGFRPAGPSLP